MRPVRDAVKIARHEVPGLGCSEEMSPVGTTEKDISIVPTGLTISLFSNPGTSCRAIIAASLTGRPNAAAFVSRSRLLPSGKLPDATRRAGGVFTKRHSEVLLICGPASALKPVPSLPDILQQQIPKF